MYSAPESERSRRTRCGSGAAKRDGWVKGKRGRGRSSSSSSRTELTAFGFLGFSTQLKGMDSTITSGNNALAIHARLRGTEHWRQATGKPRVLR